MIRSVGDLCSPSRFTSCPALSQGAGPARLHQETPCPLAWPWRSGRSRMWVSFCSFPLLLQPGLDLTASLCEGTASTVAGNILRSSLPLTLLPHFCTQHITFTLSHHFGLCGFFCSHFSIFMHTSNSSNITCTFIS